MYQRFRLTIENLLQSSNKELQKAGKSLKRHTKFYVVEDQPVSFMLYFIWFAEYELFPLLQKELKDFSTDALYLEGYRVMDPVFELAAIQQTTDYFIDLPGMVTHTTAQVLVADCLVTEEVNRASYFYFKADPEYQKQLCFSDVK